MKTVKEIEKIFNSCAKKGMIKFELEGFKRTYPHLFNVIIDTVQVIQSTHISELGKDLHEASDGIIKLQKQLIDEKDKVTKCASSISVLQLEYNSLKKEFDLQFQQLISVEKQIEVMRDALEDNNRILSEIDEKYIVSLDVVKLIEGRINWNKEIIASSLQ